MNRADAFNAERERLEKQLGYAITLEQAANMIKTASKVVSVICSYSYAVSFKEAKTIIALAEKSLDEISGGEG